MDVPAWLAQATADAEARGLPQLKPLLESLAASTAALRAAEFAGSVATESTARAAAERAEPAETHGNDDR
jgi:hypothetical protein